jgi:signal transduction histidine kinase
MIRLSFLSIKQRLVFIILFVCVISVALTSTIITLIGLYNIKENLREELELSASIVGERNGFALQIGRKDYVSENLQVFNVRPSVVRACVYDAKRNVFAFYPVPEETIGLSPEEEESAARKSGCPDVRAPFTRMGDKYMETFSYIRLRGERIGGIYIASDLREITEYIRKQALMAITVSLAVLIFAYILATRLQRSISTPVLKLADTARHVSIHKDYSMRVAEPPRDAHYNDANEIHTLIDAFNGMLQEIGERDVELQKKNVEMEKAKVEAESANMAKSRFLANISHELRTPLNAIIGFSSIITSQLFGEINPKYHEYASDIHDSGQHLLEIINDILDLSKAEAGKLTLEMEEFSVPKAIRKCSTILSERAVQNDISLNVHIPDDLPYLIADRVRFIQIMLNIMSNAVKFTEPGGSVFVHAESAPAGEGKTCLTLSVRDTGIGMSAEDIKKALQSFGQADSGLNRKYEGTGLGLPLTRRLVELHHGTLDITSEVGAGTTVTVQLVSDPSNLVK